MPHTTSFRTLLPFSPRPLDDIGGADGVLPSLPSSLGSWSSASVEASSQLDYSQVYAALNEAKIMMIPRGTGIFSFRYV